MSRIGEDYIWAQRRPRRFLRPRSLGFLVVIPLIAGVISILADGLGQGAPATGVRVVPLNPVVATMMPGLGDARPQASAAEAAAAIAPSTTEPMAEPSAVSVEPLNATPSAPEKRWIEVEIERGDTLSLAFERHGLSYRDSLVIANLADYGSQFTRGLRAGDVLHVQALESGRVLAVDYPLDAVRTLQVRQADGDGQHYQAEVVKADVEVRRAYAVGTIDTSFYVDALQAGLSDRLVMKLAHIFGWDIDFMLDIRAGDRFIVVYEELYVDGDKVRDGNILAAEFHNNGRELQALRFTVEGEGAYYAPDGDAMKKAFIRTPLDQFRISSSFSTGRYHPILHRVRAHHGTDYAAPTGTPIRATGGGRIVFRGTKGGYGNTIIIKHNNRYSTRYAHMSRFASGLGVGSRVNQGQTIGYVGQSGLATGPHLHYEFRVNGVPKNPMTVDLPGGEPLPKPAMDRFHAATEGLVAQMAALSRIQLASSDAAPAD